MILITVRTHTASLSRARGITNSSHMEDSLSRFSFTDLNLLKICFFEMPKEKYSRQRTHKNVSYETSDACLEVEDQGALPMEVFPCDLR